MTLKTLADVRKLIGHMPKATRDKDTWRVVIKRLDDAARGGDIDDMIIALRMVLMLESVPVA